MAEPNSNAGRRVRRDPRKAATRAAIIEAAESLFAEHGIEGVSLRQIGAAIGSANTSVVAYHFGSKEALVEAIFHFRLPAIDARRGELLEEVSQAGRDREAGALLRALWLPLYEQVNRQGRHSYAGFMSALIRSDWGESRTAVNNSYATTNKLAALLAAAVPLAVERRCQDRLTLSAVMITGALQLMDRAQATGRTKTRQEQRRADEAFEDALRMTFAALLADTGE